MSLINQMLKDLDSRKQQAKAGPGARLSAGVDVMREGRRSDKKLWLLPIGLLALGGIAFWTGRGWFSPAIPAAAPPAIAAAPLAEPAIEKPLEPKAAVAPAVADLAPPPAQTPSVVPVQAEPVAAPPVAKAPAPPRAKPAVLPVLNDPAPVPVAKAAPARPAPVPPAPAAELRNLRMTEQAGSLRLIAFFAGVPDYRLQRDAENRRLVIELPNTRFSGSIPAPPRESDLVQAIELERGAGKLRLVLQMKREYRYLEQFESKGRRFGDRLVLDLYAAGPLVEDSPAPEPAARAARQSAVRPQAVAPARVEEAAEAAIASTARPSSAAEHSGQITPPDSPQSRRDYARLLVDRGDLVQARDTLLAGGLPEVRSEPEHHAMLAAIYQRLGDFALAEQAYRRVLAAVPSSGVWWMGLGIALESQGKTGEAVAAYQGALQSENLRADLRRYVETRQAALGK